jgi:hypothetical protein
VSGDAAADRDHVVRELWAVWSLEAAAGRSMAQVLAHYRLRRCVDVYDACYGPGTVRMWLCWEMLRVARDEVLFERLRRLRTECAHPFGDQVWRVAQLTPQARVALDRRCGLARDALGNPIVADDDWLDGALLDHVRDFAALVGGGSD